MSGSTRSSYTGTSGAAGALSTIHSLAFCFEGRFVMFVFCLVPFPGETHFPSFFFWHWLPFHRTVMGCAYALVSCFRRDKRIHRGSGWDIPGDRTEPPAMVLHSKKILRERYCNDGFFWDRFRWGSAIDRGCHDRSVCILLGKGNIIF